MNYGTRGVLAGAYRGRDVSKRPLLTHTVSVDERGYMNGGPLCNRVPADHICDDDRDTEARPTCPVCAKRDPRFKIAPTK